MTLATMRNESGLPFSKWKPAEKFITVWRLESPDGGEPVLEYAFDAERGWRWDFAWPQFRVAVEIDGFGFGHQAIQGMAAGHEKQNAGTEQGWKVLRYTARNLGSRAAVSEAVRQVLSVIMETAKEQTK